MMVLRTLAMAALLLVMPLHQASARTFDLSRASVAEIEAAMAAGALSSEQLVRLYLARIAAYDQDGPGLNAVITLNPQALDEARALDEERRTSGPRGPLHGTAVLVKDVFDTSDMPTTGGFVPMAASQPDRDAFVIRRLREAGVVILGKLNLADWYGVAVGSASTLRGAVISPYNPAKYPGASSSGSGVAAAAWFSTVTLGSDTGGSLLIPAALNAVTTIAATRGLVSRSGMMWNSPIQETAGPMARSVYDAAAYLDAMVGFDARDLITLRSFGKLPAASYTDFVDPDGLRGMRIGVLREMVRSGPLHEQGRALFERELQAMRGAGAIIVDPVLTGIDLPTEQGKASTARYEQGVAADAYMSNLPPGVPIRSLDELLEKGGDQVEPWLRDVAKIRVLDREPGFLAAVRQQERLREAILDLMDREALDAIVLPYRTVTAPGKDERISGPVRAAMRNGLHAYTGFPAILVPGGAFDDGMPFSIEFLGRPFSEPALIRAASGYEAISHRRFAPPTTPALPGEAFDYAP